ncbi:MAG: photosynthetic complex putative assembly protein PuhB [Pseudomonadota bacterium]
MSGFENEPVHGLPAFLPKGERILWQGAPRALSLARQAFMIGPVLVYFTVLGLWRVLEAMSLGAAPLAALGSAISLIPFAAATVAILCLMALWIARTTLYTITNRRVVIRFGVALKMAVNLPFAEIGAADLKRSRDGSGTLALTMTGKGRIAFLHLWPNVRPWHYLPTQPALRAIAEPEAAAEALSGALAAYHGHSAAPVLSPAEKPAKAPGGALPAAG